MNLYFLLEGERTEKKVYESWIRVAFPGLNLIERIEDVTEDCFRLLSGDGYPQILERLAEAVAELSLAPGKIDHLFICLDADGHGATARKKAVEEYLRELPLSAPVSVIVQECCLESWFLGNRVFVRAQPQDQELIRFRAFYDVRSADPERMPAMPPADAAQPQQFHLRYLKACFREHRLSYSKSRPVEVVERHYLDQLVKRVDETGHLASFGELVTAWRGLGAFSDRAFSQESP